MDILSYFHLTEHPFRISPDPRYLYFSDQVKEAIAKCEFMAKERIGPIYMYGPIGSGKTSLLRRLYDRLSQEERYTLALVISPNSIRRSNAFLRVVMEAFEVKTDRSYVQSLKNFETFLVKEHKAGRVPVLLVDEAQNMNSDTLKLIHYLLNFETATTKLIQIILVGQVELAGKILKFQELASRMFPIAINAMSAADLSAMITFRWMVAGGANNPFTTDAEIYKVLYAYSKGLPRDAVKVCDEALRDMLVKNQTAATAAQIEQIAKEFNLQI
jgi:general secretion pathway protein A